MSGFTDVRERLEAAEQAANAGDLASANDLLRDVARIQEADLGPLHPDLANTFNNLAIVAEQSGNTEEAEAFYRRAVAIASASLPPDHPMLAASRQNLEDFCRARGLPLEVPTGAPDSVEDSPPEIDGFPAEELDVVSVVPVPETTRAPTPTPLPPVLPPSPSAGRSRALAIIAIAAIVGAIGLAWLWPRSSPEMPPLAPAVTEKASPPSETSASPPAAAVAEPPPPPKPPPARAADDVSLVTAQVCQTFSTAGSTWKCSPAGDSLSSGQLVLYTRVKSPRDAVVVHRWYRGDVVRQSVELKTRANVTEGYRTYSRQTVDRGEWRVEVRNAAGAVIHEQRFTVK
jgi:hypothetical protein